jgi:poly(3-hydroxyalkanoate) depolymerase
MPISFRRKPGPPTTRSMVVEGRPLRIDVRPGTGRQPPLLLVNGVGASLELLQPFVDALDPALEVIRFDVPGVGGSPLPGLPYRFTGLSRLMARLLSELGHDEADVLGISWGGGVAQHFALLQRHRCRRLVLVATATGSLDRKYLQDNAASLYGGSARSQPEHIGALMHAENRVGPALGYVYQLAAGAGWTSLPFLPLIRQPTLILSGDDDPLIPLANARLMHSLIRRSQLHVYHGGHLGLVTEADELAPVVGRFLAAGLPAGDGRAAHNGPPG